MKKSDRPGFQVTFWGIRGSIPSPGESTHIYGGNTSCVEIMPGNGLFICDAGTGIRNLGEDLEKRGVESVDGHLFMSHTHWDHIQGFPFFSAIYNPKNRFTVYELEGGELRHHRLLSVQMQSDYFPVSFSELGAEIRPIVLSQQCTRIEDVGVRFFPLPHPGGCYAYSFERDGCKVVYSTDCELDLYLQDVDETIRDPDAFREISKDYVSFIRKADLLIVDAHHFDEEYETKRGWGHPRATTSIDAAIKAKVKKVALFHHDPAHTDLDVDRKIAICRERAHRFGSPIEILGAREGLTLVIEPDE